MSTPLPCPFHSKFGCLLFSIGSSNRGTTLHGGNGGRKAIFSLFEVRKTSKAPLERSVLTHFVADCSSIEKYYGKSPVN